MENDSPTAAYTIADLMASNDPAAHCQMKETLQLSFSAKLTAAYGLLLAVAVGSSGFAYWTGRQANDQLRRSQISHKVYAGQLELKADAYHLFKELSDALLIGDRDAGDTERRLKARLEQGLASIRRLMAEEVALKGDAAQETIELAQIAAVERKLASILHQYAEVVEQRRQGRGEADTTLAQLLDNSVDQAFAKLIDTALLEEMREVMEADHEASAVLDNLSRWSLAAAAIAVALATISLIVLLRGVRKPMRRLAEGAEAVAAGRLDHRIELGTRDEFGQLAEAFNRMTEKVDTQQRAISSSHDALEIAVRDRTIELERANSALQAADRNRRSFLADISHELRTPLTIMRGEAEIALRSGDGKVASLHEALRRIVDSANHTGRLVDDLLFVARQETGETRLSLRSLDLVQLVPQVCEEADWLARRADGSIRVDLRLERATLSADPTRLRQLLLVLIDNAARYGAAKGEIMVALDAAPGGFALSVSDNGIGMSEEEKARAFDRYFRGADAATRYVQGTGLGLPVAKAIAQAHGGSISIASEPGRGTTVKAILPARQRLEMAG